MQRLDETQALWSNYKRTGDKAVRDRLILTYAPLVKYVAGRLGSGLPRTSRTTTSSRTASWG